ncbi:hypothetical protein QJQ45_014531, partial [Haematococcus lacustris]
AVPSKCSKYTMSLSLCQCYSAPSLQVRHQRQILCRAVAKPHRQPQQLQQHCAAAVHALLPVMWQLQAAMPASADEAVVPKPPSFYLAPTELVLLGSPIVVYAIFNVYRDRVNPKATFSDLLLFMGLAAILGNLVSIAVFKVRFF